MTTRKRVGPYEIISELGRGSFAAVFLAKLVGLELPVALKVLTRLSNPTDRARFEREAQLTSALEHPGIVGCFDIGTDTDHGWLYLALEYAPGGTLEQRLRQAPLLVGQALDMAAQMADAMAYAHGKGVLHRDLKPANVLFDALGRPRIADFSLASFASAPRLTADGEVPGTPVTMSPEQISRKPVDERTDVYALGVVLYYALTGEYPYQAKTATEIQARAMRGNPLPPSHQRPEISPAIDAVCLRAMALDPDSRFQSMQALATALRADQEESRTFVPPRQSNGLALGFIAAAGVVLIGATVMVISAINRDREPHRTSEATDPQASPAIPPRDPPGDSESPGTNAADDPARDPDAPGQDPVVARCLEEIESWSFAAADLTLSRARSEGASFSDLRSAELRLSHARKDEERVAREQHELYVKRLRPADALEGVESLLVRHPGSARLRKLRMMLLAVYGRYADALTEGEELARLDPRLRRDGQHHENQRFFRELAKLARQSGPVGTPPFAQWIPIHGGRWASEGEGVFRGSLIGIGDFGFAGLVHRAAGVLVPPFRVATELELDCTRDSAFGGILLGLQDTDNFLLVYVLHDLKTLELESGISMKAAREKLGAYPKALRIARMQNGRWQIIDQQQVMFPDAGWLQLSIEVTPGGLQPTLNGRAERRIRVSDALDGRVGVLKFYDNVVGFRGFTAESR